MSSQNEIDITLTPEQLTQLDTALSGLEALTQVFPTLSPEEKAGLVKPPETADGWMNGMLIRAQQNLGRLPRDFDPAAVKKDLDLAAVISPFELRLSRVIDRLGNARFLARSDSFAQLLGVRRALKDAGLTGVDDDLDEGLKRFFNRSGKAATTPVPATPAKG